MPTEQIRPSLPKRNLDYLVLNEPNKVEIFRKFLNRKSGRELFKPYKGKIVRITEFTYISDKGKVIRRNHLAVRLKSTQLSFSGKQLTPVKKGQKRPIVPSSTASSEDNRPLKQSGFRQHNVFQRKQCTCLLIRNSHLCQFHIPHPAAKWWRRS